MAEGEKFDSYARQSCFLLKGIDGFSQNKGRVLLGDGIGFYRSRSDGEFFALEREIFGLREKADFPMRNLLRNPQILIKSN